jgi:uncharacterized repeat protein (TIGR03803 family)
MTIRQALATSGTLLVFAACTRAQTPSPTLTTLYTGGMGGAQPYAGVVIGSGGVLYGTATYGGTGSCYLGCGTVFSLTPPASSGGAWTEAVLHSFGGSDGSYPEASVVIGSGGVLYGTTTFGGSGPCSNGCGTVFSLTPPASPGGAWTEAVLYNFQGSGVSNPGVSPLVIGSGGVLYGTAGTAVFSLTPAAPPGGAWTEAVLYNFQSGSPLSGSPLGVVIGSAGALYGATSDGGSGSCPGGCGTVFSLTPPASPGGVWTETVVHSFAAAIDAAFPDAGVVIGNGGVLYGTGAYGGTGSCPGGCGAVFSLAPPTSPGGAWTETVLYSFRGGSDGSGPTAGVVVGSGGVLYGTTAGTGSGAGTVFSLTPPASPGGAWTEAVLHDFTCGSDGCSPFAGVVIGSGGVLYGTTFSTPGTVFSLKLGTALSPSINPGGVVNAANYVAPVAPGSIAAAFGNFLLSSPLGTKQSPLPTDISGLSLQFGGGTLAPLFFVSGGQVNFQVP